MKKQALLRGLLGFPLGIAFGYIITIIVSLGWGKGFYSPCVPELVKTMGNEINAVLLQALLCGCLGTTFSASSVIWELESWSIAKQTGVYFLTTAIAMIPIAYFCNWMEHSLSGFVVYFVIFLVIFIVAWLTQYFVWKIKIQKINMKMDNME